MSFRLKVDVTCVDFNSVGNVFHALAAATEKARSPSRSRVAGTTKSPLFDERSDAFEGTSDVTVRSSDIILWRVINPDVMSQQT